MDLATYRLLNFLIIFITYINREVLNRDPALLERDPKATTHSHLTKNYTFQFQTPTTQHRLVQFNLKHNSSLIKLL